MFPSLHTKILASPLVYRCFMSSPDYWPAFYAQMQLLHSFLEETALGLFTLFYCISSRDLQLLTKGCIVWYMAVFEPCGVENSTPSQHSGKYYSQRLRDVMSLSIRSASMWGHGFLYCPSCQQHCALTMGATTESWCCHKAFTHFKRCRAFMKTEVVEWLKTSKECTVRMEGTLEV